MTSFFLTTPCAALATMVLLATPVAAQSDMDRLEAATVAAGANMEAFLVSRAPSLADVMPDWAFDDAMRAANACTLDEIRSRGGDAAVERYLSSLETFSTMELTSFQQMATETPIPIDESTGIEIARVCGTDELAMQRLQESGLMEAMMDPAVMMSLMN